MAAIGAVPSAALGARLHMGLQDYILYTKMERAKVLLHYRDRRIEDICEQLGFSNLSYFDSLFRKMTGQSPRQYRNSCLASTAASSGKP